MGGRAKQKVLRRLEQYGQIPAWSRQRLHTRRKITPWKTRTPRRPTIWGRHLIEKQRVRFHYNVKESMMQKYMRASFRRGIEYPVDNLLQQFESRIDNFCWRVGLAPTMAGARSFVRGLHVEWRNNKMKMWRVVNIPSLKLKIGDQVRVRHKKTSQNHGRKAHDDEGMVPLPAHIQWDRDAMEGTYLNICDNNDFGLHVDERLITNWYSGSRGLRRRHLRFFEGTNVVIKKKYRGGRIRPTPENIMNMKRLTGVQKRGRARPPCLWGRKYPLNSPYERSNSSHANTM
jgi:small subunit ribosomal protein S4